LKVGFLPAIFFAFVIDPLLFPSSYYFNIFCLAFYYIPLEDYYTRMWGMAQRFRNFTQKAKISLKIECIFNKEFRIRGILFIFD